MHFRSMELAQTFQFAQKIYIISINKHPFLIKQICNTQPRCMDLNPKYYHPHPSMAWSYSRTGTKTCIGILHGMLYEFLVVHFSFQECIFFYILYIAIKLR